MSVKLKVKSKTLAAEVAFIRLERRKAKAAARNARLYAESNKKEEYSRNFLMKESSLRSHEMNVVKVEARATHLARMFIRGLPYYYVEQIRYSEPDWDRVSSMVKKYHHDLFSNSTLLKKLEAWKEDAIPLSSTPKKRGVRPSNGNPNKLLQQ